MTRYLDRSIVNRLAAEAGLTIAGVTSADPFTSAEEYAVAHIEKGHMDGFDWYTAERARQSANPATLQADVRSIVSVGVPFWTGVQSPPDDQLRGKIARYAWGRDYHKTLKKRMEAFVQSVETHVGEPVEARKLVDTARVFDRAVAARSGVGWFGKNSMIIVPGHGSWVMLGEIYLNLDIEPDEPLNQNCGRCGICIDRCPTGAIVEPYRIDAPRCISFLTIEERGSIPRELRPLMGEWVFGCDVCQEVCPWNVRPQRPADHPDLRLDPRRADLTLAGLLGLGEEEYRQRFNGSALQRARLEGLKRNAAVVMGNTGEERHVEPLARCLAGEGEAMVRRHAAWALGRIGTPAARTALESTLGRETDPEVRREVERALENMARPLHSGSA